MKWKINKSVRKTTSSIGCSFYFNKCGTNVLFRLSINCNPKKYESVNHFEKYKGLKIRICVGIQSISAPKNVGWDGLYESDSNVLYVYTIWEHFLFFCGLC